MYSQPMHEEVSPTSAETNLLDHAASSYLRSARHQPVLWHPWGEAAFSRAQAENKPILLDIGAVWCHWCHVMDRESYEDPGVAALINQHFVAVKVDRDERPDVDARYQAAVSAISGQGGWPLTAFLTPDGRPYFGGTYFPRDASHGLPSFKDLLQRVAAYYRDHSQEILEQTARLAEAFGEIMPRRAPGGVALDTEPLGLARWVRVGNGSCHLRDSRETGKIRERRRIGRAKPAQPKPPRFQAKNIVAGDIREHVARSGGNAARQAFGQPGKSGGVWFMTISCHCTQQRTLSVSEVEELP